MFMATIEEMEQKIQALKQRLQKKIEISQDQSVDPIVRMARKKLKRAQRKLRVLKAKEVKTTSPPSG
jgi:hypothetical protein